MVQPNDWYVWDGVAVSGPYSPKQIKQQVKEGRLTPDCQIQKQGTGKWIPAYKVKGMPKPTGSKPLPGLPVAKTPLPQQFEHSHPHEDPIPDAELETSKTIDLTVTRWSERRDWWYGKYYKLTIPTLTDDVCICCGEEATIIGETFFVWRPWHAWVCLIIFSNMCSVLIGGIVFELLCTRVTMDAPLCDEHEFYFQRLKTHLWGTYWGGAAAVLLCLCLTPVIGGSLESPEVMLLGFFFTMVCFALWVGAVLYIYFTNIRITNKEFNSITLKGVSAPFAEQVRIKQQRVRVRQSIRQQQVNSDANANPFDFS